MGEVLERAGDGLDLGVHVAEEGGVEGRRLGGFAELLEEDVDGAEGVVDVVADAGGDLREVVGAAFEQGGAEFVEFRGEQALGGGFGGVPGEGLGEGAFEVAELPGFRDEGEDGPGVDGLHEDVEVGVGRGENADDAGVAPPDLAQELDVGGLGHALVGDDDGNVGAGFGQGAERGGGGVRGVDPKLAGKSLRKILQRKGFVIDEQDSGKGH